MRYICRHLELHSVPLYLSWFMLKCKKKKGSYGMGLLLLAVFLNSFIVQLACNLPHVLHRLDSLVSTHTHAEEGGHSHSHDTATSDVSHQHKEADSKSSCCTEQTNSPYIKVSQDSGWFSVIKGQSYPLDLISSAIYSCFPQSVLAAVSYVPPEDLPPKISDIRIFLQSLILFDVR
jgi:hypothetical protein